MGMFEYVGEDSFNFSCYLIISSLHVTGSIVTCYKWYRCMLQVVSLHVTSSIVIVSSFMSASAVENV
jgi:hypothetical protein